MADLFKKKPAERESATSQPRSSTLNQAPASSQQIGQGQESNLYSAPQESSSDVNGWGPSHSLELVRPPASRLQHLRAKLELRMATHLLCILLQAGLITDLLILVLYVMDE